MFADQLFRPEDLAQAIAEVTRGYGDSLVVLGCYLALRYWLRQRVAARRIAR